jgi:perosamine synthetase
MRIPVSEPDLSGNEERYVLEAVRSSWISSTGAFVSRFEADFAALVGTRAAIGVANGTLALHLALMTLDLGPGDEVLVPSLTYVATANAVRYCGAEPVFVDVDPATWCLDPAELEARITPRTKGIVPVHLYGHPADMEGVHRVAEGHGLWVVEDAAEAHLARYRGRPVGGLGRIGVFSFYGNKVLTSGEGGAVTLDDPGLERRARILRGQGMDPERRYYFPTIGYNYRLTNVACAILCAQIERAEAIVARRRQVFRRYRELLEGVPGIGFQPVAPWAEPSPWLFCITVDAGAYGRTRDELMAWLDGRGIETRPFFIPIHRLPPYAEASRRRGEALPVTDALGAAGLNLPTYTRMTDESVERVCAAIRDGRRGAGPGQPRSG